MVSLLHSEWLLSVSSRPKHEERVTPITGYRTGQVLAGTWTVSGQGVDCGDVSELEKSRRRKEYRTRHLQMEDYASGEARLVLCAGIKTRQQIIELNRPD